MKYRPRTNDFIEGGVYSTNKVWDIYDYTTNKKKAIIIKNKCKKKDFRYARIIKRGKEYLILVRR